MMKAVVEHAEHKWARTYGTCARWTRCPREGDYRLTGSHDRTLHVMEKASAGPWLWPPRRRKPAMSSSAALSPPASLVKTQQSSHLLRPHTPTLLTSFTHENGAGWKPLEGSASGTNRRGDFREERPCDGKASGRSLENPKEMQLCPAVGRCVWDRVPVLHPCLRPKLIISSVALSGDTSDGWEEAASLLRHSPSRKHGKQIVDGASGGVQIGIGIQMGLARLLWFGSDGCGCSGRGFFNYEPAHGWFTQNWWWWVCFQLRVTGHVSHKPFFKS